MSELLNLPPDISGVVLAALLLASFASSLITVALGIGGGALLIAVLATLMPPAALIPVHGIVQLGSNATRLGLLIRWVSWAALPVFVIGSLVGSMLGGLVVVELSPAYVQIGLGCFVIWTIASRPPKWLRRWPFVTGMVSSFLTMFFGATGLFVASYTKSLELGRHAHVATHAALMTVQHALKVVVFGLLGFAFSDWAAVIVLMVLSGVAGTVCGKFFLNRLSDYRFKWALDVVLVLISLRLIWSGVTAL